MEAVLNPYNGAVAGHYTSADLYAARAAVSAAHEAFATTRFVAASDRAALLSQVSALITGKAEALAKTICAEAGKPIALARTEVQRTALTFKFAAQEAAVSHDRVVEMHASPAGKKHTCLARRVPVGVILGVSPFNFPLNLVAHKVAPCIATGNTMVLKPSPRTPMSAFALAEILAEAGTPPCQVQVLPFSHEFIPELLADPRIRMLSFTGSAEVGWNLKRLAARQKVLLELGGNAAVILHSDADWRGAVPMIANAAFAYSGQSCISVQRVFVHSSIYQPFRDALMRYTEQSIHTGDPADEKTVNGPMIDAQAKNRVLAWVREALERGARSAWPLREEGNCLFPIILENVRPDARIEAEEAFGPVVTLNRYEDIDAALAEVNASRYGLQAGIFTSALELAERAFNVIDAGAVLVNQVPTFRVENMPYGGVKDSGFGREGVLYAMEEMTEWKSFIVRLPGS